MASSRRTEYEIALLVGGKVQASFENSMKSVNSSLDSMTAMAKNAAKLVTASFAAVQVGQFIGDAVATYASFEQSMANTAAIANASAVDYQRLEEAALEMGKATTKTATEASEALGYMALAGWNVDDSITALEPVLRLSEATQMDLATCSDLVTDSMSALGLSVDELSGYLDVCTAANNNANTTAEALMEAFIGCGGAAKTIGADVLDTATALGVLANNGTKGAEAGTALNSMLVRISSKDTAIAAMESLGVSAFDASGNFIGLQEVLVDLQGALSDLSTEEQAAYMAQIAGTNYYTEMSYLLDSVAQSADGTASAWNTLSGSLETSDGALINMASTVTDTLSTSFEILNSATEDAKIHLVDAFGDDLKDMILNLAEFIPTLTERFIDFATKAGPKISRTFTMIQEGVGTAWNILTGAGEFLLDNFDVIEKMIAGVGTAIVTYKVISGFAGVAEGIKGIGIALKTLTITNPWLLGITAAVSGIAGIAGAMKMAEKQAVKSNLDKHFGDIALSMNDISQAAEFIIASDNLNKIYESMAAFDELEGIQNSMQDSIDAINKMNWKVSVGMELTADEQTSYTSEIQNYIAEVQNYVEQERYALDIGFSAMDNLNPEQLNAIEKIQQFYADKSDELAAIGTELSDTVTAAFADGFLDIDEANEISELQAQMARIQEAVATSDFDAKLKVMELQYSGAELDAETFQALQEELAAQAETAAAAYEEALAKNLASAQVAFDGGELTKIEYDSAVDAFWEEYLTNMSEMEAKSLNFQTNTILQQYSEELEPAIQEYMESMKTMLNDYSGEDFASQWENNPASMWQGMFVHMQNNELDADTEGAIHSLLEAMQPSIERAEELKRNWEALGQEIPQAFLEGMSNVETLNALAGDQESIYYVLGQQMAGDEEYEELIATLNEKGYEVPTGIVDGMNAGMEEKLPPAVDAMYTHTNDYLQKIFEKEFDISADVNINLAPTYSDMESYTPDSLWKNPYNKMMGHAKGGIFDTPHIAWFAEEGPEAAIPLDGSSNAISLWEKAGQLLGVFGGNRSQSIGSELYNGITKYETNTNHTANESTDNRQFVFSPNITIEGNAERENVENALQISMEQFRELMEQYSMEKGRVSFA